MAEVKGKTDIAVLTKEKEALEEAMERATALGQPQLITVGDERFVVSDDGVSRIIEPVTSK